MKIKPTDPSDRPCLYRYMECQRSGGIDPDLGWTTETFHSVAVELFEFEILRETPKGYWVVADGGIGGKERWVGKTDKFSRKRFAYATKEAALDGYIARKERQLCILSANLELAKVALGIARGL